MKNLLLVFSSICILLVILILISNVSVWAQTNETSSQDSSNSAIEKLKKIEILKEKIATKVAQLREDEQGGFLGTVKTIDKSQLLLQTKDGEKTVRLSDDTSFYTLTSDHTKSESSLNKLKTGESLTALGYFDTDKTILSAKYIFISTASARIIGKIGDIDKSNFTITVIDNQGNNVIDIEKYSKLFVYAPGKGFIKSGFSKLKPGDVVHMSAKANPTEKDRYWALQLYSLTFTSPTAVISTPSVTEAASPSAQPKPNATGKPTPKQSTSSATPAR